MWHLDPSSHLATTDIGRKLGAPSAFGEGELGPHLMQCGWPGSRLNCVPSFILIHPTVWPQYTNVTDRTDTTDRQTDRQRSDSIGRTVLQPVAQNHQFLSTPHYLPVVLTVYFNDFAFALGMIIFDQVGLIAAGGQARAGEAEPFIHPLVHEAKLPPIHLLL